MTDSLIETANNLLKQKQFAEAGKIFHQLWDDEHNGYAASRYIHCLRKAEYSEIAVTQGERAYQEFSDNIYVQRELIWSYYDSLKKTVAKQDLQQSLNIAYRLLQLNPEALPLELTVIAIIKLAKEQNNWTVVYDWCQKITSSQFSKENPLNENGQKGKTNREIWYFAYLKSALNLGHWNVLKKVAIEASKSYPREINFKRYYALSLANLGEINQAIAKLEDLLLKERQEWYLFQDLAELYLKIEQKSTALRYFCKAALATKEDKLKVSLYQQIAETYLDMNNLEIAAIHLQLSKLIRQNEGWKIKDDLQKLEIKTRQKYTENNLDWVDYSLEELKPICLKNWRQESYRGLPRYQGIIESLPTDKAFAWIKTEDGQRIFCLQKEIPPFLRQENTQVSFVLEENWDHKKAKLSTKAVDIQK
jgi:hypothetical protein